VRFSSIHTDQCLRSKINASPSADLPRSTECRPPASSAPAAGPLAPGQRWSVAHKRAVVLRLIAGEPVELVSREIGVPVFKLERWRERAEAALEGALKEREADGEGPELAAALQRIGELSMEVELLRAKMGQSPGPLARKRWR
jgi:transposase